MTGLFISAKKKHHARVELHAQEKKEELEKDYLCFMDQRREFI